MTSEGAGFDAEAAAAPRPSLVGLDRNGLAAALSAVGVPGKALKMRVEQLWHWIYQRGVRDFLAMSNVAKELRQTLSQHYTLARPEMVVKQVSVDGTRKWLLRLPGRFPGEKGHDVECVYIPEEGRGTLCVSSQVGCTLTCTFCHTGTQRLVRNLTAGEIVAQLMVARDDLNDWPGLAASEEMIVPRDGGRYVTNIVFMGMGEPLYNLDAVSEAISTISDGDGLAIGRRKITVSTSGVVPMIGRLGDETGAMLAISLHATTNPIRDRLVPLNKKYPIEELLAACAAYPGASNARRITFEYVMLKGVNDAPEDARRLVSLLDGLPAKINLIPFNPWPGTQHQCSDWPVIERFSDIVFAAGYASPVRTPRGRDILAACGQLRSETIKLSSKERELALAGQAAP